MPLVAFPTAATIWTAEQPAWIRMWALAFSIYAALKCLSLANTSLERVPPLKIAGYLLLWPGMDARTFLRPTSSPLPPSISEALLAAGKILLGFALIYFAAPRLARWPLAAGWISMIGLVFVLHFGLFHLASICWRAAGVAAEPIMNAPIYSTSLGDFWRCRWNRAFRDLAYPHVFRPLVGRVGPTLATIAVFIVSGLIHDAVISIPAGGGFGLPTLYFAIHAAGILFERSCLARRLSLDRGLPGWTFCAAVSLIPVGLLFHPPFIHEVILPMLSAIGALR